MIVPSMSYAEIRKEFLHDMRVADARAQHTYKQLQFNMHHRHQKYATEAVTWQSPFHNTWMSFYALRPDEVNYFHACITLDRQNLLKALCAQTSGNTGELYIAEFNIHFLKRYNERMKLNLPKPMLIVKHYFKQNMLFSNFSQLFRTEIKNEFKIFLPVNGGVLLGYQYEDQLWIEVKTFISDEMLKESQIEKAEYLKHYKV